MPSIDYERWQARLAAARGERDVDLLLVGGRVINVFNATIEDKSVAVFDGHVVGFGDYHAREVIYLNGKYLAPGFIEGHIHIESSKLTPPRFAEAVVPHGTTTVIADPHEIANVWGVKGIEFMIKNARDLPLSIFYMLPSCVPATTMETAGAVLTAKDLKPLLNDPHVLGIAELMNFPGAYLGDRSVLEKAALATENRPIDGHAPGLGGKNLFIQLCRSSNTRNKLTGHDILVDFTLGIFPRTENPLDTGGIDSDRFFAVHMLTRIDRCFEVFGVKECRARYEYRIDIFVCKELLVRFRTEVQV